MREIVTLQLGNLSNYAATHFWNTQESYFSYSEDEELTVNHDIHWRAGIGADGCDTFLPRALVYDLKGGFGSLRKVNPLYDDSPMDNNLASASLWSGNPVIHKQTPLDPGDYQRSLNTGTKPPKLTTRSVRYWSDFTHMYYHPRSLVQLYDYELHSSIMPFESFSMGTALFESLEKENGIIDRDWRPFVEECDQMQGVQIYTTLDDAWGGFASSYLESLRDEHPKSCIWVWGLQSPMSQSPRGKRRLLLSNTARTLHESCTQASMVVPLAIPESAPPSISIDRSSAWQISGLLTTAAESALLESRLSSIKNAQSIGLADMAQNLNVSGNQPLANMHMTVGPAAVNVEDCSQDINLSQIWGYINQPNRRNDPRIYGQLLSVRGLNRRTTTDESADAKLPIIGEKVLRKHVSSLSFPLLESFPQIYADHENVESIQVRTSVSSDSSIAGGMKKLRTQVRLSFALDERETLDNGLAELGSAYQDDWSSGSDQDDDEL